MNEVVNKLIHSAFYIQMLQFWGFPGGVSGKEAAYESKRHMRPRFQLWVWMTPWRRARQPTLIFMSENPMDRGAWRATVHRVAKGRTQLK